MGLLEGKVALVTGGGRGIGRSIAQLLGQQGARILVADIDSDPAQYTVDTIRSLGGQAAMFVGDLTDPKNIPLLMETVVATFGGLDILVNNAGYTWDGMAHKMTDDMWQAMLDIHLTVPFRLIREAAPYMRAKAIEERANGVVRCRKIINVTSVSGLHGNVGQANYAAAKAGIIGLTKTVAREWGPFGITCNAVAFGFVDTRLTQPKETGETIRDGSIQLGIPNSLREDIVKAIPLGRTALPKDAAGAVLLLTLPWADYITGQILEVNGGLYM